MDFKKGVLTKVGLVNICLVEVPCIENLPDSVKKLFQTIEALNLIYSTYLVMAYLIPQHPRLVVKDIILLLLSRPSADLGGFSMLNRKMCN